MNPFEQTLKEVTEVFASCGCQTHVSQPSEQEVVLTIQGPTSICPPAIFEEHVEKAQELMQASHPEVRFQVEVKED